MTKCLVPHGIDISIGRIIQISSGLYWQWVVPIMCIFSCCFMCHKKERSFTTTEKIAWSAKIYHTVGIHCIPGTSLGKNRETVCFFSSNDTFWMKHLYYFMDNPNYTVRLSHWRSITQTFFSTSILHIRQLWKDLIAEFRWIQCHLTQTNFDPVS